jgi:hypothetical protein
MMWDTAAEPSAKMVVVAPIVTRTNGQQRHRLAEAKTALSQLILQLVQFRAQGIFLGIGQIGFPDRVPQPTDVVLDLGSCVVGKLHRQATT